MQRFKVFFEQKCNIYLTFTKNKCIINVTYILHIEVKGGLTLPNIENRVKTYRLKKGITQETLAELIQVTRQTVGLIEKGEYNPTIYLCLKLSEDLETSLDQLFNMEEKNEKR